MLFDTHVTFKCRQFEEDLQEVINEDERSGSYIYGCCWI